MDDDAKTQIGGVSDGRELLMLSLSRFYSKKEHIQRLRDVVDGSCQVSLRLIDWFVTNYAKKYNTVIVRDSTNSTPHFNVYLSYRSHLKAYSKQMFDPFRRRDRMHFYYEPDKYVETTLGQLNFFRWVIQNSILEHISENATEIEHDMVETQRDNQDKRLQTDNVKVKVVHTKDGNVVTQQRKRRNELSRSLIRNMNQLSGAHTITFE
jgi:hypothetical protein